MSLIPDFELGLWNAWILMLPLVIISIFGVRLFGKRVSGENSSDTRMRALLSLLTKRKTKNEIT